MRFTMSSEDKSTMDSLPVVIIPAPQQDASSLKSLRKRKMYVIIAATGIIALVVILTAILVGMYLFTEAQKDILKFTLKLDSDKDQEVVSDPNTNIVKYHIQEKDYDAWIVNDYNKGLTVMRIQKESDINCYVTPFNNSKDLDLSDIQLSNAPPVDASTERIVYKVGSTPISDTTFLSKVAQDTCKGIPTTWLYPECLDTSVDNPPPNDNSTTALSNERSKRAVYYWCGCCYCFYSNCNFYWVRWYDYGCGCYKCTITYYCGLWWEYNAFYCNNISG